MLSPPKTYANALSIEVFSRTELKIALDKQQHNEMIMNNTVLVTGAAGYIGSHTLLCLIEHGYHVIALDNFSNSSPEALIRVQKICGKNIDVVNGDIRDSILLDSIFTNNTITAVLHFAGSKAVGESICKPLDYYANNFSGTINLCQAMQKASVFQLVFSSSATVYGIPNKNPISEKHPTGTPTNPYGRSKLMVEEALKDLSTSDSRWNIALLRYFNPAGAHPSGDIGEDPKGSPNNLVPYVSKVAVGSLNKLSIFGNDYPTPDGTGIRDYIHVMDLADGHIKALNKISKLGGLHTWNLGTGEGYSVLDIVTAFEKVSGQSVSHEFVPRRPGDIAECWSDPGKALNELGWHANRGLDEMMADTWRWQSKNPNGYCD